MARRGSGVRPPQGERPRRLRPADYGQRAVTARQSLRDGPPFPENLAARTRTRQGTAHRPAPSRLGRQPARRGRPAAKWSPAPRLRAGGESCTSRKCGPGPSRGGVHRVQAGGLNPWEGAGLLEGRTGEGEKTTKSAWHQVCPEPREQLCRHPPASRGAGKSPRGPGRRPVCRESSPPRAEAPAPGATPGPDSAAGPALAHTQKMLNETTPTLLAPRPSSGR